MLQPQLPKRYWKSGLAVNYGIIEYKKAPSSVMTAGSTPAEPKQATVIYLIFLPKIFEFLYIAFITFDISKDHLC